MKIIVSYTTVEHKEIEVSNDYTILRDEPDWGGPNWDEWNKSADALEREIKQNVLPKGSDLCAISDGETGELLVEYMSL